MRFRAYKYRIYPTTQQLELINKTIGSSRFVYNMLLSDCKKQYEETGHSVVKSPAYLKTEYEWLKEVDSLALCNAQLNLKTAYNKFFKKETKFPVFHSKKSSHQSYTTNSVNNSIRIENGKLRLPKLGLVKTVFHRYCYGKIKSATISKTRSGKYYVSILTEQSRPKIIESEMTGKTLGVDMSFHGDFAVYSDGKITNFPNYYLKAQRELTRLNRKFARTKPDSKNHYKLKLRIARYYEKLSNQLKDWHEKESLRIAKEFDVITFEDVNMKFMAQMRHGKKVLNNGFGQFRGLVERKSNEHLREFIKASKWFPSSQICNVCGFRNPITKNLQVLNYDCPKCGTRHNRDINASKNLRLYGEIVSATEVLTPKKSACGWDCKTCKKEFCSLIQAGSCETSKIVTSNNLVIQVTSPCLQAVGS